MLVLSVQTSKLAPNLAPAALPRAAEHLGDRVFEAGVRVRDDELDTSEATLDQAAKEAAPERLGLALTEIETDHLPVAGLVHPVGQYQTLAHHPGAVTDLLDLRIEPQIRAAPSSGRLRNASRCSSRPSQILETSLLEIRSPSDSTTWSTSALTRRQRRPPPPRSPTPAPSASVVPKNSGNSCPA